MIDTKVEMEIIAFVGITAVIAIWLGQTEIVTAAIGGLVGYLGANKLTATRDEGSV